MPRAIAHIATIGARYGSGGSCSGPIRVLSSARSARFSDRYPARKTTRITLSSSDGCPDSGPIERVSRAPLTSRSEDEREQQERDAGRRPGVLVGPQPGVRADGEREDRDDRERDEQPAELELRRARDSVPPNDWVTRSCGSRCIRSRPMPPSIATAGSSTWSVPPPGEDERHVDGRAAPRDTREGPGRRVGGSQAQQGPRPTRSRRGDAGSPRVTRRRRRA